MNSSVKATVTVTVEDQNLIIFEWTFVLNLRTFPSHREGKGMGMKTRPSEEQDVGQTSRKHNASSHSYL